MKLIFSTQKYAYLQKEILKFGPFEKGETLIKNFPDGERYKRILSDIDNRDIVLVGGTVSDADTLELYDLACGLAKNGSKNLILVIPYYGYSTMERAAKKGEVVTAKTRARLISAIPQTSRGNHLILLDLHTEGIPHYFEGNLHTIHLYCKDIIVKAAKEFGGDDFILACTDAGRAKWVESLANDMGVNAAFVFKRRFSGEETAITGINADVSGKTVVIYDDMIRTGGSLINAAKAYQEAGAKNIFAITTHGLFTNNAIIRLKQSELFEKIITTDTHANTQEIDDDFLEVKSVAKLIAERLQEIS